MPWQARALLRFRRDPRLAHNPALQFAAEHAADLRNRPDQAGASRLSPYLHFGELVKPGFRG